MDAPQGLPFATCICLAFILALWRSRGMSPKKKKKIKKKPIDERNE
jgi:hypothetical protein